MEFEGWKAQLEKELQKMKSSLDIGLENHAWAKENWFKELSSLEEKLVSTKKKIVKLLDNVESKDVKISLLKSTP